MSATAPVRRPAQLRGSAALRLPDPSPSRSGQPQTRSKPRLVLVAPQRTTAGRLPFLILVGTVLAGGLVAVLLLHMMAAQDAFRVTGLQQRLAILTDQEQQEAQLVAADSSPTALQARAVALGMVPTTITKFHRRAGGRAVGVQTPVYVPPPVVASPNPGTTPKTGAAATSAAGTKHSPAGANKNKQSPAAGKAKSQGHSSTSGKTKSQKQPTSGHSN